MATDNETLQVENKWPPVNTRTKTHTSPAGQAAMKATSYNTSAI